MSADVLRHPRVLQVASLIGGLLIWQAASTQFSHFILPAPTAVIGRYFDPAFSATLLENMGQAFRHMLMGFGLSLAAAIPIGIILGRSRRLNAMFDPVISALYAIPPVAFVPFLIIWFGLFYWARVALVVMMTFPDILVIVTAGAKDVRRQLVDAGRAFGATPLQNLRKVVLPATTPFLIAGLRIGAARAINGMITAELFFAAVNLGKQMKDAGEVFDTAGVMAVVLAICLVGLASQSLVNALETRFLGWHVRQ